MKKLINKYLLLMKKMLSKKTKIDLFFFTGFFCCCWSNVMQTLSTQPEFLEQLDTTPNGMNEHVK
jgi:hypothetical protein